MHSYTTNYVKTGRNPCPLLTTIISYIKNWHLCIDLSFFFLHFLIILISYRSAGRMLFIGCGPFSQKIGDHGEMMSCILVHVLLLLVFPTLFFAEFRKNNFYAYYSVFQTMFVQPELGCYRHVHVPLLVWGTLILLDSPRHFFC